MNKTSILCFLSHSQVLNEGKYFKVSGLPSKFMHLVPLKEVIQSFYISHLYSIFIDPSSDYLLTPAQANTAESPIDSDELTVEALFNFLVHYVSFGVAMRVKWRRFFLLNPSHIVSGVQFANH